MDDGPGRNRRRSRQGATLIHYHGGPITPETAALRAWAGRHAFVSFAHPTQIRLASTVCQSFALDNGAFTAWKAGVAVSDWSTYYAWTAEWLTHPACDFAVIPDVIGGSEMDNDRLLTEWPHGHRGVPVWHLNESIDRLVRLAEWPRVALGSTAEFNASTPSRCLDRLNEALPAICVDGRPITKLHGLRMLNPAITSQVPLTSGDSTNVARNIGMDKAWNGNYQPATRDARAVVLVERIESVATPGRLVERSSLPPTSLFEVVG